jgi:AcrR family transcriptional regulator
VTEPTAPVAGPGLRADAERNRQRVVDAACALFEEHGLDVPLEDVARAACVGIATLYRRFPTRADLTGAVFVQKFSAYVAVVDRAVAETDPWQSVVALVNGLCELQAVDAGLRELLTMRFPQTPEVERLTEAIQTNFQALVTRARDAGVLRQDIVATDLALILLGNSGVVDRTYAGAPDAWRRYAGLMLEALRVRPDPSALPPAPSIEALRRVTERP